MFSCTGANETMKGKTNSYEFAKVYDQITEQSQDEWLFLIEKIARIEKNELLNVLDLGTGTGKMAIAFAELGCAVTGIDQSKEMLKVAREKSWMVPHIAWVGKKIEDFKPKTKFDLIVSIDVFNHFLEPKIMEKVCREARKHLNENGLLIFNIATQRHVQDMLDSLGYGDVVNSDTEFIWLDKLNGKDWSIKLKVLERMHGNLFKEKEYRVDQRVYELEEVKQILKKAGFKKIKIYGDRKLKEATLKNREWLFVCKSEP
ncbi:MAG: methyltransferase domain-containing protein [Candidatus Diapherotrites archaeon]|nr:methyltransferase domain-containing protein [Candidatus Diapherotrites archaeon]